ncbi:uncharacterized protein LOC111918145 [Lactuca sativa]|uniref:uncharacterized protein LOC111918145 n=1 Tax=Lactuca sativa TaxID=4236 RepID=UPI000CD8B32B|nr:uncharacterized protein LOC111918145 [Lactuca sativa]
MASSYSFSSSLNRSSKKSTVNDPKTCDCGFPAHILTSTTPKNQGRHFSSSLNACLMIPSKYCLFPLLPTKDLLLGTGTAGGGGGGSWATGGGGGGGGWTASGGRGGGWAAGGSGGGGWTAGGGVGDGWAAGGGGGCGGTSLPLDKLGPAPLALDELGTTNKN